MSLFTLPAPVSPTTFVLCPKLDVVVFSTESHLILCRRSGQQIWNTRLPHVGKAPVKVDNIKWNPNGLLLAVVFGDGRCLVYDGNSGRPLAHQQQSVAERVASIAWTAPRRGKPRKDSLASVLNSFTPAPDKLDVSSSLAAVGTVDGYLRLNVYGALEADERKIGNESSDALHCLAVDEERGIYAAAQGSTLYVYRSKIHPAGPTGFLLPKESKQSAQAQFVFEAAGVDLNTEGSAAESSSLAILFSERIVHSCEKLQENLKSMENLIVSFVGSFAPEIPTDVQAPSRKNESLKLDLLNSVVFGVPSMALKVWMEDQHEQGFKRWYKAMSQCWDTIMHTLTEYVLDTLGKLAAVWGRLKSEMGVIQDLHELSLAMLSRLVPLRDVFEKEAGFLEHLFREEIDRPIAVTKVSAVTLSEVGDMLIKNDLFGGLSTAYASHLLEVATKAQAQLNESVANVRSQLRNQLDLVDVKQLSSKIFEVVLIPETMAASSPRQGSDLGDVFGQLAILTEAGELFIFDYAGNLVSQTVLSGTNWRLIPGSSLVISVDREDKLLLLSSGRKIQLHFEPLAITTRRDADHIVACVLSEDCQHYEFFDIA